MQLFTREMARQASIAPQLKGATSPYDCGEQEERLQCVDMVSINEASVLCGIPSAVLKRWAAGGRVLGLEHVDAGMKFPRWQFEGHMRNAIAALFEALETKDAWKVLHWIESPFDSLDGKTPRAAIEQGDVASARRVTRR